MTKFSERWREIDWRPFPPRPQPQCQDCRANLPAPILIRDQMDPVRSMASGKMYDSKSAIRAEYRRLGMEEVGNDSARLKPRVKPKSDRKAINDTVEKAAARFERGERAK